MRSFPQFTVLVMIAFTNVNMLQSQIRVKSLTYSSVPGVS